MNSYVDQNFENLYYSNLLINFGILVTLIFLGFCFVFLKYYKASKNNFFDQNFSNLKITDKKYFAGVGIFISILVVWESIYYFLNRPEKYIFYSLFFIISLLLYLIWFYYVKIKISNVDRNLTTDEIKNFDKIFSKDILYYSLINLGIFILLYFCFQIICGIFYDMKNIKSYAFPGDNDLLIHYYSVEKGIKFYFNILKFFVFGSLPTFITLFVLNIYRINEIKNLNKSLLKYLCLFLFYFGIIIILYFKILYRFF